MAKTNNKNEDTLLEKVSQSTQEVQKEVDISDMPLTNIKEYLAYNARARAANKRLKIRRYPILQCPVELHPTQRVVFGRNDQPDNPLPVFLSNEMIEYKETLIPGKTYDLPLCVLDYLAQKGTPIWKYIDNPDGSRETRKTGMSPRFAMRTIYAS